MIVCFFYYALDLSSFIKEEQAAVSRIYFTLSQRGSENVRGHQKKKVCNAVMLKFKVTWN